jgi:hypothetical protein
MMSGDYRRPILVTYRKDPENEKEIWFDIACGHCTHEATNHTFAYDRGGFSVLYCKECDCPRVKEL